MGKQTEAVRKMAQDNKWDLEIVQEENKKWTLWRRDGKRKGMDWLVVGAHGCSEHEANIEVENLQGTKIYFLTQRLAAAPSNPNSWYVTKASNGERWSTTKEDWYEVDKDEWRYVPTTSSGLVEVFDTRQGQKPFDYHLVKYNEDTHIRTIRDMYEGVSPHPFDVLTVSKQWVTFSEILQWLAKKYYRYPNIVAGFCNSYAYSKFLTPFGDYVPAGAQRGKGPPRRPLPPLLSEGSPRPPLPPLPPGRPLPARPIAQGGSSRPPLPPRPIAQRESLAKPLPRIPHGGPPTLPKN